jgi:uncharacterized protein YndB with AHSA1/START domain
MSEALAVPPIVIEIASAADPVRAWRAVTDPAEVAEWFANVTPVDGVGSPYRIDFGDGTSVEGRIRTLDPGRRLAYSWAWAGEAAGLVTLVTWEVEPAGAGSRIRLTHDGWSEAGADEETRNDHADYWEEYLDALAAALDEPSEP